MIVLTHTALFYNKLAHDTSAFLGNEEFFVRIAGIICEYNPFHNGHAAQLAAVRAAGAQCIAVCMSSGAVQRGGVPILPESVRVRAALDAGADLVVALPAPYACATAEQFAAAGVHLLAALGCPQTEPGDRVRIAMLRDTPAGMVATRRLDGDEGALLHLALLPEHRGCGLAAQLLGEAICPLRAGGAKHLRLLRPVTDKGTKRLLATYGITDGCSIVPTEE